MENKKGFVRIGDDILEVDAEKLKNEIIDVSRCIKVAEVKKEPCEHKWIIDEFNQDVCKKCRINKQFYEGIRLGKAEQEKCDYEKCNGGIFRKICSFHESAEHDIWREEGIEIGRKEVLADIEKLRVNYWEGASEAKTA